MHTKPESVQSIAEAVAFIQSMRLCADDDMARTAIHKTLDRIDMLECRFVGDITGLLSLAQMLMGVLVEQTHGDAMRPGAQEVAQAYLYLSRAIRHLEGHIASIDVARGAAVN